LASPVTWVAAPWMSYFFSPCFICMASIVPVSVHWSSSVSNLPLILSSVHFLFLFVCVTGPLSPEPCPMPF
jgi:hypothetical protein